jgi:D-ribose pyranase
MLISGIINPLILSLVARARHTDALVIADAAFKSWPGVETIDVSLIKGLPTVNQVMEAVLANWKCGEVVKSQEFLAFNGVDVQEEFRRIVQGINVTFEPFADFKARVPFAAGIIRTGETMEHGNVILISA